MAQQLDIFQPSFGNKPQCLVGRRDMLDEITTGLLKSPGSRERAMIISGQRGIGKTALLLEISDLCEQIGYIPARVTTGKDMLENVIEEIQINGEKYLKENKHKLKGFSAGAFGFSVGLTFSDEVQNNYGFRTKLTLLCERLESAGKGVLIIVDEVQPNSEAMRTLTTAYQHLVGDGKNIAIIMAGLPAAISNVLNDDILTFLNLASKKNLGPLRLGDVRAYFRQVFVEKLNKEIADDVLENAVKATEGFPYLMQLIGYYLESYSQGADVISEGVLEDAIRSARLDMGTDIFETTLNHLSDVDTRFLKAMAEDSGPSTISDIKARLDVSDSYVQMYKKRLMEAGVIVSPRRGEIEFAIPYIGEYLRNAE